MTDTRRFATINLQAFPGREGVKSHHEASDPIDSLSQHRGLVLVIAGERGATEDRFGLGAALKVTGGVVHEAYLIIPDDRPDIAELLRPWCKARKIESLGGSKPWLCITESEFLDPRTGVFTKRVYTDGGQPVLITADLGRTLGLIAHEPVDGASWPTPRSNFWSDGLTLHIRNWAKPDEREGRVGTLDTIGPHRPPLRIKPAAGHGWLCQFAPAGRSGTGTGKRNRDGSAYRGRFFDVIQGANVFDGLDTDDLAEHFEAFGFERLDVPTVVSLDKIGAEEMARSLEAVHRLALRLDDEATKWFTTTEERKKRQAQLDLVDLRTSAGVATALVRRAGVISPLVKFPVPDDKALQRWTGAHKGGWLSGELTGAGVFPAVDVDIHSAYPTVASLLGWWGLMTAAELMEEDALDEVITLCQQAAIGDVSALLDPETWRRLAFTICEVLPDGERWPVEAPDEHYPQGHSGVRPLRCSVPVPFTWADVVNAALLSGRVPNMDTATRLVPVGRQKLLRGCYPLYDGRVLAIEDDPAVALVQLRDEAKARGDKRLGAQLRVLVNALSYGNLARIDTARRYDRSKRRRVLSERAAEYTFPPIAASVTAGCRLLVGVAERLIVDAGGMVASRDTDGLLLVASPEGGKSPLLDGREVGAISWPALDKVLARFDPLYQFDNGIAFFKSVREHDERPLYGRVGGIKRWAMATLDDSGELDEVVEWSEHSLGGGVVDPPRLPGFDESGARHWTREVVAHGFRLDLASQDDHKVDQSVGQSFDRLQGTISPPESWSWDEDGDIVPCLEREQVIASARIDQLRKRGLKVRPGSHVVVGLRWQGASLVALDPGGDLADWRRLDWRDVNGDPVVPSVRTRHASGISDLDSLAAKALRWLAPRQVPDGSLVEVDRIAWVGKAGELVEAGLIGPNVDTSELRAEYDDGELLGYLTGLARELGERRFVRQAGVSRGAARRFRDGKAVRPGTIRRAAANLRVRRLSTPTCALEGCDKPVFGRGARYCSQRHQHSAAEARHRSRLTDRLSAELGDRARELGTDTFARRYGVTHRQAEALGAGTPVSLRDMKRIASRIKEVEQANTEPVTTGERPTTGRSPVGMVSTNSSIY